MILSNIIFNGYVCSAVFAVVMTILSVVCCAPILRLLNTPDDIFMHAYNYIVIIFAGIPTVFLYNIVSGIIRSLGDSKTPVYFLVLSSVINIALDFINSGTQSGLFTKSSHNGVNIHVTIEKKNLVILRYEPIIGEKLKSSASSIISKIDAGIIWSWQTFTFRCCNMLYIRLR